MVMKLGVAVNDSFLTNLKLSTFSTGYKIMPKEKLYCPEQH